MASNFLFKLKYSGWLLLDFTLPISFGQWNFALREAEGEIPLSRH
jgi:hypothetical protein